VEDEALVRLMLVEMLTELGHDIVAEASNLEAAIAAATAADYDLAVLDLNLGNGITYNVVEAVLGRGKAVVLSTGYGGTGIGSRYEGCIVLQKPFTREAIGRAVELSLRQTPGRATPRK
jgi:CheY-like chemotaxis protein